eukprot:COSAG06_NODE_365_length_16774_cov_42.676882_4_plen_64_part_00
MRVCVLILDPAVCFCVSFLCRCVCVCVCVWLLSPSSEIETLEEEILQLDERLLQMTKAQSGGA